MIASTCRHTRPSSRFQTSLGSSPCDHPVKLPKSFAKGPPRPVCSGSPYPGLHPSRFMRSGDIYKGFPSRSAIVHTSRRRFSRHSHLAFQQIYHLSTYHRQARKRMPTIPNRQDQPRKLRVLTEQPLGVFRIYHRSTHFSQPHAIKHPGRLSPTHRYTNNNTS